MKVWLLIGVELVLRLQLIEKERLLNIHNQKLVTGKLRLCYQIKCNLSPRSNRKKSQPLKSLDYL